MDGSRETLIGGQVSSKLADRQILDAERELFLYKTHNREHIISSFFATLRESWHDPVLRQWRWERLRGRAKPETRARDFRPGGQAAAGAALYKSGLDLGDETKAAQGLRQMLSAAEQSIGPSGATLEGSTLRQVQLARLLTESWLAARSRKRPEQVRLAGVARSVIGALDAMTLPGGLPEIGGTPSKLSFRDPFADLDLSEQRLLEDLRRQSRLHDLEALRRDGWLRLDAGPWSGLWYCPASGWPAEEGLAHHDLGAPELHWNGLPLFVDPGPPPATQAHLSARYRSAVMHGGLSLNGDNPYPENRPYYTGAFRRNVAGPAPDLRATHDGVRLAMDGFGRFGGHRQIERHWRFDGASLRIDDLVLGTGRPRIERRLITPWAVSQEGTDIVLIKGEHRLVLSGEGTVALRQVKRWNARGDELPLTMILFTVRANLPWNGSLILRPASA